MRDYDEERVFEEMLEEYSHDEIIEISEVERNIDVFLRDMAMWGGSGELPDSTLCNMVALAMRVRNKMRNHTTEGFEEDGKVLAERDSWAQ